MRAGLLVLVIAACGGSRHDSPPPSRPQPTEAPAPPATSAGSASVAPSPAVVTAPPPVVAPPEPAPEPAAWLIKVHNVRVGTLRTSSTDHWDGVVPETPPSKSGLCGVIGAGVGGVAGAWASGGALAVGGATLGKTLADGLCPERRSTAQRERDPQAPDLVVALTVGDQDPKRLPRTPTARDSYDVSFDYAFVVPTDVVPPRGLQVWVQDQDGESDYETIGSVYLTRDKLRAASGSPLLVLSDGGVQRLELTVVPAPSMSRHVFTVDVAKGLQVIDTPAITAGEIVEIQAEGSYKVAPKWPEIGPTGGKGKAGTIREEPFASAPHGSAIATIGIGTRIDKLLVPSCVRISARFSGQLIVGVNDAKASDNSGELKMTVVRRAPTAAEWLRAGVPQSCN